MKKMWVVLAALVVVITLMPFQNADANYTEDSECPECHTTGVLLIDYINNSEHWVECLHAELYWFDDDDFERVECGFSITEPHFGIPATCTKPAYCVGCGHEYGEVDPNAHHWDTKWTGKDGYHWHQCTNPGCTEISDKTPCSGGTATCTALAVCDTCKQPYGKLADHVFAAEWTSKDGYHWHQCTNPDCTEISGKTPCSGGTATCTALAVCDTCKQPYGKLADHVFAAEWTSKDGEHWHQCTNPDCTEISGKAACSGGTATCTALAVCAACKQPYGELADHVFAAEWTGKDGYHWHQCTNPDCTETSGKAACSGGAATCTEPAKCSTCQQAYGSVDPDVHPADKIVEDRAVPATCTATGLTAGSHCEACKAEIIARTIVPAKDHTWKAATCTEPKTCTVCGQTEGEPSGTGHVEVTDPGKPATCKGPGLTEGKHCSACGEVLVKQQVIPALVHWYGPWLPAEAGTHRAECRRCGETALVGCTLIDVPLASGTVKVCPVCGYVEGGEPLTAVEGAKAAGAVPAGDLVVFTDGSLITVAFEIGGRLIQPAGSITLTLPDAPTEGMVLIGPDGTETAAERATSGALRLDFAGRSAIMIIAK